MDEPRARESLSSCGRVCRLAFAGVVDASFAHYATRSQRRARHFREGLSRFAAALGIGDASFAHYATRSQRHDRIFREDLSRFLAILGIGDASFAHYATPSHRRVGSFGKVCRVFSPRSAGWWARVKVARRAGRSTLTAAWADRLGTPISRLASFDLNCQHSRPQPDIRLAILTRTSLARDSAGRPWSRRVVTVRAYPPFSQPLLEKCFQSLFSMFHPRPLRVPHAQNRQKPVFSPQRGERRIRRVLKAAGWRGG